MLDVLQRLLEAFVTSLTAKQLAASEGSADLLAILIFVANHWKQLEFRFPLSGAQQHIFLHHIHSLRYGARRAFIFRFGYIVVERVLLVGRS